VTEDLVAVMGERPWGLKDQYKKFVDVRKHLKEERLAYEAAQAEKAETEAAEKSEDTAEPSEPSEPPAEKAEEGAKMAA